jgi:hypothetical protein
MRKAARGIPDARSDPCGQLARGLSIRRVTCALPGHRARQVGDRAECRHRSPRNSLTKIKSREPEHEEMLKIRIDPTMFLKTKEEDRISIVFVPENAQISQKFGLKRLIIALAALF